MSRDTIRRTTPDRPYIYIRPPRPIIQRPRGRGLFNVFSVGCVLRRAHSFGDQQHAAEGGMGQRRRRRTQRRQTHRRHRISIRTGYVDWRRRKERSASRSSTRPISIPISSASVPKKKCITKTLCLIVKSPYTNLSPKRIMLH